jgi:hypothetical protein
LHDLLKPHVAEVLVCDPRKNASMKTENKNDRADAGKLAELLYLNKLDPVYPRLGGHKIGHSSDSQQLALGL